MIARRRLNLALLALAAAAAVLACAAVTARAGFVPAFDSAFGKGGVAIGASPGKDHYVVVQAIASRPDGGWVEVGYRGGGDGDFQGTWRWAVAAFRADGTPDTRFARRGQLLGTDPGKYAMNGTGSTADAVAVQPDGKILVGGVVDVVTRGDVSDYERASGGDPECQCGPTRGAFLVARYRTNGKLDHTFGKRGYHLIRGVTKSWSENGSLAQLKQIVVAPNGRIHVFGHSLFFSNGLYVNAKDRERLLGFALRRDGSAIKSFGTNGRLLAAVGEGRRSFFPQRFAWLDSGGFAVVGSTEANDFTNPAKASRLATVRLTATGQLDRSYNGTGWRERTVVPNQAGVSSADIGADGSATFMLQRFAPDPSSSDDTVNTGVLLVGVKPDGELDQAFGGGVVDITATSGGNQLTAGNVVRLQDGSLAALTSTESASPDVASIVPVSAAASIGVPFVVSHPALRGGFNFPAKLAASGPGLVLGGSANIKNASRAFLARLISVSP
jgi:hypothetical protein